ncbi:ABC transporter permease [Microvenator marinus]|uniref:ABC transporter permease n=1 Tax=Microvenator marinus TaxID=2600177 RepID=A0A5B8XQL8_9DELT|nr:ABC transporter permease [Microvenator marinus]QED27890.1 ABC transporter permease [Microvenator marinus]
MSDAKEKKGFIDWFQGAVLADRYLETVLADWKNTLLLLSQAPILAALAVMVWGNVESGTPALYFVMTLSVIWLGCMDSCREVVKERALFLRERMFNLNVASYLYSKARVLALLNVVQVVIYAVIIHKFVDTRVPVGWSIINLLFSALCGTCLGLLISSSVRRSDYAVGLVPLVILPQILFSEFSIDKDNFEGASRWVFNLMPSRWGYESMLEFADSGGSELTAVGKLMPLAAFSVLFLFGAWFILRRQRY